MSEITVSDFDYLDARIMALENDLEDLIKKVEDLETKING